MIDKPSDPAEHRHTLSYTVDVDLPAYVIDRLTQLALEQSRHPRDLIREAVEAYLATLSKN